MGFCEAGADVFYVKVCGGGELAVAFDRDPEVFLVPIPTAVLITRRDRVLRKTSTMEDKRKRLTRELSSDMMCDETSYRPYPELRGASCVRLVSGWR